MAYLVHTIHSISTYIVMYICVCILVPLTINGLAFNTSITGSVTRLRGAHFGTTLTGSLYSACLHVEFLEYFLQCILSYIHE